MHISECSSSVYCIEAHVWAYRIFPWAREVCTHATTCVTIAANMIFNMQHISTVAVLLCYRSLQSDRCATRFRRVKCAVQRGLYAYAMRYIRMCAIVGTNERNTLKRIILPSGTEFCIHANAHHRSRDEFSEFPVIIRAVSRGTS